MSARDRYYAAPIGEGSYAIEIKVDASNLISADGVNYGLPWEDGGPMESARRQALATAENERSSPHQVRRAKAVLAWLDLDEDAREATRIDKFARAADQPQPAPEAPRVSYAVEVRASDGALLVDGDVYAEGTKAARVRAVTDLAAPVQTRTSRARDVASRVLDFLDSAAERVVLAAYPPVPAAPTRPRVCLRAEVEVNGLLAVDLGVYVHASAPDTTHAITAAARALHDATLAALHVLVVEPADPAGGAS